MKYMRRTAGYIWTDYKTNAQIAKELKITPILDKLLEYKRNWIHVNRMPHNRLPMVIKRHSPTGRRNHGRPLKRLLDTWDRNGSTSGPTPWQIYDDDDLVIVCSTCFEHRSVHPHEDLYVQFYGISFIHPYRQCGWWQDVLDTNFNNLITVHTTTVVTKWYDFKLKHHCIWLTEDGE